MTKLTKEEVRYSRGMKDSHCGWSFKDDTGYCKHFIRTAPPSEIGRCQIVSGEINALFWCEKFKRAEK